MTTSQPQADADSDATLPPAREEHDVEQGEKIPSENLGQDPNIVDWEGPDDPANPLNWSGLKKNLHVAYVSLFVLYA